MIGKYVIEVEQHSIPDGVRNFLQAVLEMDLCYTSRSLTNLYKTDMDLHLAIRRVMRICLNAGMPLGKHFRAIYIFDGGNRTLKKEWKMSKIAYYLTLVDGSPDNPVVGRIQLEMLKGLL